MTPDLGGSRLSTFAGDTFAGNSVNRLTNNDRRHYVRRRTGGIDHAPWQLPLKHYAIARDAADCDA